MKNAGSTRLKYGLEPGPVGVVRPSTTTVELLALVVSGCYESSGSYGSSYWFCWDNPAEGGPHHLGHPVSGDHPCSEEELKNQGEPPS